MPIGKPIQSKPGQQKSIMCPSCDGSGHFSETDEESMKRCKDCNGTGRIAAKVIKQRPNYVG